MRTHAPIYIIINDKTKRIVDSTKDRTESIKELKRRKDAGEPVYAQVVIQ